MYSIWAVSRCHRLSSKKTLVFLNPNPITSYAYLQELKRIPNHKTKVLSTKNKMARGTVYTNTVSKRVEGSKRITVHAYKNLIMPCHSL